MANPLKSLGQVNKFRKQAKKIQDELSQEEIRVEEGDIVVVISGDQKIKHFSVQGVSSEDAVKVLNKAISKSQKMAGNKLKSLGGLGDLMGKLG